MNKELKILLLEGNREKTALINEKFSSVGIPYYMNVLESNANFSYALEYFQPDLVIADSSDNSLFLSDFVIPDYVVLEDNHEIHFILIGNDMKLEFAIDRKKAGMDDFVLKNHLEQLPIAFESIFFRKGMLQKKTVNEPFSNRFAETYFEIEERNKNIMDSILYAKRIQEAILPNREVLMQQFPESFILYRPKDIVSGDFYWFEEYQSTFVIVAADCTGHGVSGALISMIGHCLLNTIVVVRGITRPSEIIRRLNNGIRHFLKQDRNCNFSGDGMDIAVCAINRDNQTLQFAGANRSLYYFTNNKLELVRGNKFGIGGRPDDIIREYSNYEMSYDAHGIIYLCTDGFADQLGGSVGKRLSTKRMLTWLESINQMSADVQLDILNASFDVWKGDNEQTDDVLMIGLRLSNVGQREYNFGGGNMPLSEKIALGIRESFAFPISGKSTPTNPNEIC